MSPRVSVVIPAYRSQDTVAACLESLRAQTFRDFETLVVNSSPEEDTRAIVTQGFPEVLFEQSPRRLYPHAARNLGVQKAAGEILAFTDPDCRARPEWLACLVAARDAGHHVVGGAMELLAPSWRDDGVHLAKFSWLLPGLPPGPVPLVATANACYSREAFAAVGPFDAELFVGDALLAWRAARAGYAPWFEPRAVVEHRHDFTTAAYLREFFVRGRELGRARPRVLGWTRGRALAQAAAAPLVLAVVLARAGRASLRAGWSARFLATLPLSTLLKAAWTAGETLSALGLGLSSRRRSLRSRALDLLLALLSVTFTVLVFEAGFRLLHRPPAGLTAFAYVQHDPLLGWSKRPGFRGRVTTGEVAVDVAINSRGLRDIERPEAAPPGDARILVLGDSFVEGVGVEMERDFVSLLRDQLRSRSAAVDVVNAGTSGYSTDQELLFYRNEGRRYGARVVLLVVYQNDIAANAEVHHWSGFKPVFAVDGGALVLRGVPVPKAVPTARPGPADASGSALGAWVRGRLAQGAPEAYGVLARLGLWLPLAPIAPALERRVYESQPPPEIEDGWQRTALLLRALADDTHADGARLAVLYAPDRSEVADRCWRLTCLRYGWSETSADQGAVVRRLRAIVAEAQLPFLDLTPALRRADARLFGNPYFRVDSHWTASGHRVVADAVKGFLRESGWIGP